MLGLKGKAVKDSDFDFDFDFDKISRFDPMSIKMGEIGITVCLKKNGQVIADGPTIIYIKSNAFWYSTVNRPDDKVLCTTIKTMSLKTGETKTSVVPIKDLGQAKIIKVRGEYILNGHGNRIYRYFVEDLKLSRECAIRINKLTGRSADFMVA